MNRMPPVPMVVEFESNGRSWTFEPSRVDETAEFVEQPDRGLTVIREEFGGRQSLSIEIPPEELPDDLRPGMRGMLTLRIDNHTEIRPAVVTGVSSPEFSYRASRRPHPPERLRRSVSWDLLDCA